MIKSKKQMFIVIGVFTLVMMLGTVTFAFFNYTRTGAINNLGTGRIYFSSEQNGSLELTNIFPVKSEDVNPNTLNSVTVGIEGDTTYTDGEEYKITLVDVNNTFNNKKIPINYIATYVATQGNSIGASSDTYWESRESKDASIYTINTTGSVEEGEQVLVGYIDNRETGINGILTIKAYIDADRIAITDTYPEEVVRTVKTTGYSSSNCETVLNGVTNASTYCASATSLQEAIDNEDLTSEQITLLVNAGIVEEYTNGTTSNWVNGRTVFTTTEWNSFQNSQTPISFKIRAESNEGIWVEEPSKGIESCPGCKFMYPVNNPIYTTWNTSSQTPSVLTSGLYENYQELIGTTNKNYFIGVKLNNNNEVTNAYACGVKDNVPFCIEGTSDGSKYADNQTLLQGSNLYNNTCTLYPDSETGSGFDYVECGPWDNSGPVSTRAVSSGDVFAGVSRVDDCLVNPVGIFVCVESGGGE